MQRHDLTFPSGGDFCAAWLYRPTGPRARTPIVVMAHGLSGTRRDRLGRSRDRRVAAAIGQVPFLDTWRQAHRSSPGVTARIVGAAVLGRPLPAVGQPHEAAFINAPGSGQGWRRVVADQLDFLRRHLLDAG